MKRWPIIRHARYFWYRWRVERHYEFWLSLGMLPFNKDKDEIVLRDIWSGKR